MVKKKGPRTTEAVGVMTKERVRQVRRERALKARGGRASRSMARRETLARRTVPGTWIVHYEGGAKAKAHREYMMGVHARRLAGRKRHEAQLPALRARASRQVPMMVSSMVGSPSPRKFGVYGKGMVLQWFPTRKTRRTFITEHPKRIQWKWPKQTIVMRSPRMTPRERWFKRLNNGKAW